MYHQILIEEEFDGFIMVEDEKQIEKYREHLAKQLSVLSGNRNSLKIKLVLSEISQNYLKKVSNRIMAPVLNKMGMLPEYG